MRGEQGGEGKFMNQNNEKTMKWERGALEAAAQGGRLCRQVHLSFLHQSAVSGMNPPPPHRLHSLQRSEST